MAGITPHGIRYPDGASKAKDLGPELKTMAEDIDGHIDSYLDPNGPIRGVVEGVAEDVVPPIVEEYLDEKDVLTVPRMHDEYGFEKDGPHDATVRVIVNSAGQMVAEMRDDENGWRWHTPIRIADVYDLTPREDVGLGQPVVGSNGRMGEATTDTDGNVPPWVLQRWKERMGLEGGVGNFRRLTVRPNPGSGEYSSPKTANDAAASLASASTPVLIDVHPGVYTEVEWTVHPHVTIRGRDRDRCILAGELPDSATDAQISGSSTLWLKDTAALENLTITARNMRYPVHSESNGDVTDYEHKLRNVVMRHFGNAGVREWRTANPGNGNPASVWSAQRSWGHGASSGGVETFEQVTFIQDYTQAFYFHTNRDWSDPARYELRGCRFICEPGGGSIRVEGLGSGVTSTLAIYDSEFSGVDRVSVGDSPWISQSHLPADHWEADVTIAGTDRIGYTTGTRGRAVRLTSAAATSARIGLSGSAVSALFGSAATHRPGGGSLESVVYGWPDVSGILVGLSSNVTVNNTMGRRLGDCSSASKSLTVSVGGNSATVTFDQDYREASNATILAAMNSALSGIVTADLADPTWELHYPDFPDRQATLNATSTIRRGQAVKRTTGGIAPVGTGDAASAFYGVAVESGAPGSLVRVITRGTFDQRILSGLSSAIPDGATVYLSDSTAGGFSLTGTRPALRNAREGFAEL